MQRKPEQKLRIASDVFFVYIFYQAVILQLFSASDAESRNIRHICNCILIDMLYQLRNPVDKFHSCGRVNQNNIRELNRCDRASQKSNVSPQRIEYASCGTFCQCIL